MPPLECSSHELPELWPRESGSREILPRVRRRVLAALLELPGRAARGGQVLPRMRRPHGCPRWARGARPDRLHPPAPGRADPPHEIRARGRAQEGDRALRGCEGLDGAGAGARPRGVARHPRPLLRDPDRGRAPLRGHRQPVHR
jgi:hypothetical protein